MIGAAANGLLNNLVSYWKLDESSGNALDAHGSNDGIVTGATQGASGKINTAYSFDGNDYVNIDGVVDDLASTTTGTWSAWVKPVDATPSPVEYYISFGDTNANEAIAIHPKPTGELKGIIVDAGTTDWALETDSVVFSDNTWTHIAIVQNGTEPVLYVDGVAVAQTFTTSNDKTSWLNQLGGLDNGRIGNLNFNSNGEKNHFNGTIDEVGIWSRALTGDDITTLYNSGSGLSYDNFTS